MEKDVRASEKALPSPGVTPNNTLVVGNTGGPAFPHTESRNGGDAQDDPRKVYKRHQLLKKDGFQTTASINTPLSYDNTKGAFKVGPRMRMSVSSSIPKSAANGRWSAQVGASTESRGPVGAASGSLRVGYEPSPKSEVFGSVQVGDQAQMSCGGSYRTEKTHVSVTSSRSPTLPWGVRLMIQQSFRPWSVQTRLAYRSLPSSSSSSFLWIVSPEWNISLSSKTRDPVRIGLGYNRTGPHLDLSVQPTLSNNRRVRVHTHWRTNGLVMLDVNIMESLASKISMFGIGVQHHSRAGLSWIFTFVRGGVTVRIPVSVIKTASLTPFYAVQMAYFSLVSFLIQEVVADLWSTEANAGRAGPGQSAATSQLLDDGNKRTTKSREEAAEQQKLMERQANKRHQAEKDKDGLVVTKAVYFVDGGDGWDVTIPLRFWTYKSSLDLRTGSKQDLLGFYNVAAFHVQKEKKESVVERRSSRWSQYWPAPSSPKESSGPVSRLAIQYEFEGVPYEISIRDTEPLSLPSNRATERKPKA